MKKYCLKQFDCKPLTLFEARTRLSPTISQTPFINSRERLPPLIFARSRLTRTTCCGTEITLLSKLEAIPPLSRVPWPI